MDEDKVSDPQLPLCRLCGKPVDPSAAEPDPSPDDPLLRGVVHRGCRIEAVVEAQLKKEMKRSALEADAARDLVAACEALVKRLGEVSDGPETEAVIEQGEFAIARAKGVLPC